MQLAVRAKELHCRRGWNDDHWSAAPDDIVLEVRFKSPGSNSEDSGRKPIASERTIELRSVESIVSAWDAPVEAGTNPDSPRP